MKKAFDNFNRVAIVYDITQDGQRAEAELVRDLAGEFGFERPASEAATAAEAATAEPA